VAPVLNDADVRDRIRRYVEVAFLRKHPKLILRDDDWLMKKGIVDSMGVIELIKFLKSEFGVEVSGEDITEENLGSVAGMTRFVIAKRTLGPAPESVTQTTVERVVR
jgi:acyl carrier protein